MQSRTLRRTALIGSFALASLLPVGNSLAAIPCHESEVIPAPPNMAIPMIYIELPVDASMYFGRGQAADRTNAIAVDNSQAGSVEMATINQIRCLNYQMSSAVLGNSTPGFRVLTTGVVDPVQEEEYIAIESAHLVQFGDVVELEDGRYLIDFTTIVDGNRFFEGEMVFIEENGELYQDGGAIRSESTIGNWHEVEVSERFTREVKIVEIANGDAVDFNNVSEESWADITITDPAGETVFVGNAMPDSMAGGETQDIFVAHDLEPGEYTATVTFEESGIKMSVTISVSGATATPEAATPQS